MVKTGAACEMKEKSVGSSKPYLTKKKKNPLRDKSPTNDQPVVEVPFMPKESSCSGELDSTTVAIERPVPITITQKVIAMKMTTPSTKRRKILVITKADVDNTLVENLDILTK